MCGLQGIQKYYLVAGAFSLVVNHTSIASGLSGGGEPRLAMTSGNNQITTRPMADPESGGHEGAYITGGLIGVLATLAKLTVITVLVLCVQKGASLLGNRRPHLA